MRCVHVIAFVFTLFCLGSSCNYLTSLSTVPIQFGGLTVESPDNHTSGSCGAGFPSSDEVIEFTAPVDGTYVMVTQGSNFDTLLYVRDGDCNGAELACNDDGLHTGLQSRLEVTLTAGQVVAVIIDGFASFDTGVFNLFIELEGQGGDIFVTSCSTPYGTVSTVPAEITGSIPWESNFDSACVGRGFTAGEVAIDFVAPSTSLYVFEVPSPVDADEFYLTSVHQGGCQGTPLGDRLLCAGELSSYQLTAGQRVTIVVDRFLLSNNHENESVNFTIGIRQSDSSNIHCNAVDQPITLDEQMDPPQFTIQDSVQQSVEPQPLVYTCANAFGNPGNSHEFTVPASGLYEFDTEGSSFDTILTLWNEQCDTSIACNDDQGALRHSQIRQELEQGQVIRVVVDGYGPTDYGPYTLVARQLSGFTSEPRPIDNPTDVQTIVLSVLYSISFAIGIIGGIIGSNTIKSDRSVRNVAGGLCLASAIPTLWGLDLGSMILTSKDAYPFVDTAKQFGIAAVSLLELLGVTVTPIVCIYEDSQRFINGQSQDVIWKVGVPVIIACLLIFGSIRLYLHSLLVKDPAPAAAAAKEEGEMDDFGEPVPEEVKQMERQANEEVEQFGEDVPNDFL